MGDGTYMRVLAGDIGIGLGSVAHLEAVRRTEVGDLKSGDAVPVAVIDDKEKTLEQRRAYLKGADFLLQTLPEVRLDAAASARLRNGQRLAQASKPRDVLARAYDAAGAILGVVRVDHRGTVHPHRLIRFGQ